MVCEKCLKENSILVTENCTEISFNKVHFINSHDSYHIKYDYS